MLKLGDKMRVISTKKTPRRLTLLITLEVDKLSEDWDEWIGEHHNPDTEI